MVAWVYECASESGLDKVIVATDDVRIHDACLEYGCETVMTSEAHATGTDRVREAIRPYDAGIIVNIQGDELLIQGWLIDRIIKELRDNRDLEIVTASAKIVKETDLHDTNVVKVVADLSGRALYFSRSLIPFDVIGSANPVGFDYYKHIGIYGFRRDALERFSSLDRGRYERMESLEQLRALENGMAIKVIDAGYESFSANTPSDLERFEEALKAIEGQR